MSSSPHSYILTKIMYNEAHNKVWGVVLLEGTTWHKTFWCWWAEVDKNLSIKRHAYNSGTINRLESKKRDSKYVLINEEELLNIWPDFKQRLVQKMLFEVLSNHD